MGRRSRDDASSLPTASPRPEDNTGYAEETPADAKQARVPGAKRTPDSEEGGLEHESDQAT